jgi:hypothetical protein
MPLSVERKRSATLTLTPFDRLTVLSIRRAHDPEPDEGRYPQGRGNQRGSVTANPAEKNAALPGHGVIDSSFSYFRQQQRSGMSPQQDHNSDTNKAKTQQQHRAWLGCAPYEHMIRICVRVQCPVIQCNGKVAIAGGIQINC